MTNYISKINNYQVGGNDFNGSVTIFTSNQQGLIEGDNDSNLLFTNTTIGASEQASYSVADVIPNDGYDYELCLSVWSRNSTSGTTANLQLQGFRVSRTTARANTNYTEFQTLWLPLYNNSRTITFSNYGSITSTYNCQIHGYRRIGKNGTTDTNLLSSIDTGNKTYKEDGWTTPTQVIENKWSDIIYANNKFIAMGLGYITSSTDGITWTTPVQIGTLSWHGVYGNNKFVAVGSNLATSSTDGITWTTPVQIGGTRTWHGIAYGNGKFVAVGSGNYITTSTNGTTWTDQIEVSPSYSSAWYDIVYANNKFVAVGGDGYITTSTNGTTWTTPIQVGEETWSKIIYADGKFVVVGYYGNIATSTNGTTWNTPIQVGENIWKHITYGNGMYMAIDTSGNIATSENGTNWTSKAGLNDSGFIAFGNDKFVAVCGNGYITYNELTTKTPFGGDNFDGQWILSHKFLAQNVTYATKSATTYSLANYLPNDGNDYMVSFSIAAQTTTSSGSSVAMLLLSGTQTFDIIGKFGCRVCQTEYHNTSYYACAGNVMLPISANDRNITLANFSATATGSCTLTVTSYRRIGKNL